MGRESDVASNNSRIEAALGRFEQVVGHLTVRLDTTNEAVALFGASVAELRVLTGVTKEAVMELKALREKDHERVGDVAGDLQAACAEHRESCQEQRARREAEVARLAKEALEEARRAAQAATDAARAASTALAAQGPMARDVADTSSWRMRLSYGTAGVVLVLVLIKEGYEALKLFGLIGG